MVDDRSHEDVSTLANDPTPVPVVRLPPRLEGDPEPEELEGRQMRGWPWLLLILVLGIAGRAWNLRADGMELASPAEFDQASIARNFASLNENPAYPQVDWGGASPGYVRTGLPIYAYGLAQVHRFAEFEPWMGRALNVAAFALSTLLLYALVRRAFGSGAAVFAALFYAACPLVFGLSRTMHPEPWSAVCALAGIYGFWIWIEGGRGGYGLLAALACGAAFAADATQVVLWVPLAYLALSRFGVSFFKQAGLWLFGIATLAAAAGWHAWAMNLESNHGNTMVAWPGLDAFGAFPLRDARWGELGLGLLKELAWGVATPVGILYLAVGALASISARRGGVFLAWAAGILAFAALVPRDSVQLSPVEIFPLCFATAGLMGWGARALLERKLFSSGTTALLCAGILGAACWQLWPQYVEREAGVDAAAFGARVAELTEADDRIVLAAPLDAEDERTLLNRRTEEQLLLPGDPRGFYYAGRRGWSLRMSDVTPELLCDLARRGATHFATMYPDQAELDTTAIAEASADLEDVLSEVGTPLEVTSDWAIYALAAPEGESGASVDPAPAGEIPAGEDA